MEPGNEPFIERDEMVVNGRRGTVAHSAALEKFWGVYYHASVVWHDDLSTAQLTDNKHQSGQKVVAFNPRTKQNTKLIMYRTTTTLNETKETAHAH